MCINAIAPHKHGLYKAGVFITATALENRGGKCVKPDARRVYLQPVQQRAVVTHRRYLQPPAGRVKDAAGSQGEQTVSESGRP